MGKTSIKATPHCALVSDPAHPGRQNVQASCFFVLTCIRIFIFLAIIVESESAQVDGSTGVENEPRRGRHGAMARRYSVLAAPPLQVEDFLARRGCRLTFMARWLLFLLVTCMSLSWPTIQGPLRVLTEIDIVSMTHEKLIPVVVTVKEVAVAVRKAATTYKPEKYVALRLLEALANGIIRALY
ncbi:hypothetical protein RhiJN_05862 [Ceratobasidium sp. AG-Ba]|nr:hypothetical protein RhiJN_05862 [Ceratobasidium sp. AG-Ba]QRW06791.1 hypothetical protein RhiLY_05790 [Ceratobasidium sp. AG-Ba]